MDKLTPPAKRCSFDFDGCPIQMGAEYSSIEASNARTAKTERLAVYQAAERQCAIMQLLSDTVDEGELRAAEQELASAETSLRQAGYAEQAWAELAEKDGTRAQKAQENCHRGRPYKVGSYAICATRALLVKGRFLNTSGDPLFVVERDPNIED